MPFVSHAQNLEDVMLWRALRGVERGFYVDVGAAWPDEHSVTRAFYDRGWRGVNVEPSPRLHAELSARRPRDVNLCVAAGVAEGGAILNVVEGTGLSTLDGAIADRHARDGRTVSRCEVPLATLASLWVRHVPEGQDVHFLKIDVEGLEEDVLRGNDWARNRPWIVVVEATLPMTQVESHGDWEPILLSGGYRFAWADGLNRFYVCEERAEELLPAFRRPPNCFDDFVPAALSRAEARVDEAEVRARAAEECAAAAADRAAAAEARAREAWTRTTGAEARARDAESRATAAVARAREAEAHAAEARRALAAVEGSLAWRFTRPLRRLLLRAFPAGGKRSIAG